MLSISNTQWHLLVGNKVSWHKTITGQLPYMSVLNCERSKAQLLPKAVHLPSCAIFEQYSYLKTTIHLFQQILAVWNTPKASTTTCFLVAKKPLTLAHLRLFCPFSVNDYLLNDWQIDYLLKLPWSWFHDPNSRLAVVAVSVHSVMTDEGYLVHLGRSCHIHQLLAAPPLLRPSG